MGLYVTKIVKIFRDSMEQKGATKEELEVFDKLMNKYIVR